VISHRVNSFAAPCRRIPTLLIAALLSLPGCVSDSRRPSVPDQIRLSTLISIGTGGPNAYPNPGRWADADPKEHVAWLQGPLAAMRFRLFACPATVMPGTRTGWFPNSRGLKYDFLPEMVRLGHRENMLVFGYFCIGSNTRWGQTHPDLSYGIPSACHIPFTDEYLAYLNGAIQDAVKKTGMDGFMVDWVWLPNDRSSTGGRWLDCEKKLYAELMGEPFPGEDKLTTEQVNAYGRKSIERCWKQSAGRRRKPIQNA